MQVLAQIFPEFGHYPFSIAYLGIASFIEGSTYWVSKLFIISYFSTTYSCNLLMASSPPLFWVEQFYELSLSLLGTSLLAFLIIPFLAFQPLTFLWFSLALIFTGRPFLAPCHRFKEALVTCLGISIICVHKMVLLLSSSILILTL